MSTDDQGTKRRRNIAENFNRLRLMQMTDGRASGPRHSTAYNELEREFAFAKK